MSPRVAVSVASGGLSLSTVTTQCSSCLRREFSSTHRANTRLRRQFFAWLEGPGENFRHPLPNSTNYLTQYDTRGNLTRQDEPNPKPFPLNPLFISQPILSESLRQEIWKRVQVDKKSVRQVSVELGVDMGRVGAVVRLVELERRMRVEGKSLALPYARAVHSMVQTTPYDPNTRVVTPHESINDLPVHTLTDPQIFYPTSESRSFNRVDAGRVFSGAPRLTDSEDADRHGGRKEAWTDTKLELTGPHNNEQAILKPADSRIPHPHLVAFESDKRDPALAGMDDEIKTRYAQRLYDDAKDREDRRVKKIAREEAQKKRVESGRWEFIVTEAQTTREGVGLDGRGTKSPGFAYGVPSSDRKRGQVKIPTSVRV